MRDGELHRYIVNRIEELLDGRSWRWLARESGVAQSTLATQKGRSFSELVLAQVAMALKVDVGELFPPGPAPGARSPDDRATLDRTLKLCVTGPAPE